MLAQLVSLATIDSGVKIKIYPQKSLHYDTNNINIVFGI